MAPEQARLVAGRLIDRFGSLGATLSARTSERLALMADRPDIDQSLVRARRVMHHVLQMRIEGRPLLGHETAVLEHLRARMAYEPVEQFRVLYLNARNELLCDEVTSRGSVNHVCVYPREILKRALEVGATALVLAHNHPSGDPAPSGSDRSLTAQIVETARGLDIVVHDHLIIAQRGWTSFRDRGLL
jgi:DNA repair protein RadC